MHCTFRWHRKPLLAFMEILMCIMQIVKIQFVMKFISYAFIGITRMLKRIMES